MAESETRISSNPHIAAPPFTAPTATTTGGNETALRRETRLMMLIGALLVAGTSVIHLHLWMTGYRHIATIGPLFLLQAVGGFALAVAVAVWPRWYVAAIGSLFLLATAGGLLISTQVSLFGFKDSFSAPYAGLALILEGTGAVILSLSAGLLLRRRPTPAGDGRL